MLVDSYHRTVAVSPVERLTTAVETLQPIEFANDQRLMPD